MTKQERAAAAAARGDGQVDGPGNEPDGTGEPEQSAQEQAAGPDAKPADLPESGPEAGGQGDEQDAEQDHEPATATLMPCNNGAVEASPAAKELLLDACERWGVNPTVECRPRELAAWNFYPANRTDGIPAAVVIVTAGGVKLKHWADAGYPPDADTEDSLARVFGAFYTDPKTKDVTRLPLPVDQALPVQMITGRATRTEHRFRRGYLREGGKREADRRDAAARKKK